MTAACERWLSRAALARYARSPWLRFDPAGVPAPCAHPVWMCPPVTVPGEQPTQQLMEAA